MALFFVLRKLGFADNTPMNKVKYIFQVTITPNGAWGGEGSLGCGIGYGYLHRIPMDQLGLPPEQAPLISQKIEQPSQQSRESPANIGAIPTTSVPIVPPPMMSMPHAPTMPPLPPVSIDRSSASIPPEPVSAPSNVPIPNIPATNVASPIIPEDRSSITPPTVPPPPPSSATSNVSSDYVPPIDAPFFGTGAIPKTTIASNVPMFTMPPENMPVPDPAVLAGMPVPPTDFNLSVNGTPNVVATTSDAS